MIRNTLFRRSTMMAMTLAAPLAFAIVTVPLMTVPAVAQAQQLDLQDARQQGLIGERPDGLLGAVVNRKDVILFVEEINRQRMQSYQRIAQAENTPIRDVQAIAGQKILERLPSGSLYMAPNGQWAAKP